ncbi:hypothetical protein ACQR35_12715 [Pseudarthrobacter sp. J1738]|uniref:hypothetical protein n=1 Tax=unclassified Pseudarthrobacter TaxID=2647000 RepID=UPI003D2961CC
MDRIEELMKAARPNVADPKLPAAGTVPGAQAPLGGAVVPDEVGSKSRFGTESPDAAPEHLGEVSTGSVDELELARARRKRGTLRAIAAVVAVAAAAAAVVIGLNLAPLQPKPSPATNPNSASPSPTASSSPSTSAAALTTGGVACTVENIDERMNTQNPQNTPIAPANQGYYKVLGCADGWLAYEISDAGVRAMKLDGGNAWYMIAKVSNGRFLHDSAADWSTVLNWEFQAMNNSVGADGKQLTAQEAMDAEFTAKGIPVQIRQSLVGKGPGAGASATPTGTATTKKYSGANGVVSFQYPSDWTVAPSTGANGGGATGAGAVNLTVKDAAGKEMAKLSYGGEVGGLGGACGPERYPYSVLDFEEMNLPYNADVPASVTPRFTYRAVEQSGKVYGTLGLTTTTAGTDGTTCMFYNVVNGPTATSRIYSFADVFEYSASAPADPALHTFNSMNEAQAYMLTPEYQQLRAMLTSLKITTP